MIFQRLRLFSALLRVDQWYKNLVLFVPLFFADRGLLYPFIELLYAFVGFCCVSSLTYMVNDWLDREKDRLHPVKKNRPLASGKITGQEALWCGVFLAFVVVILAFSLGKWYALFVLAYLLFTNSYSFGLKNVPLLDILMVSANFLFRMAAGFRDMPESGVFPYFGLLFGIIVIFLTHKRRSDIKLLGEKSIQHKPVLKFYTPRNNYFFRAVAYGVVLVSLFALMQDGFVFFRAFGLLALLVLTSFLFSDHPEWTIRPQHLFKSVLWDTVLMGNIVVWMAF